MKHYNRENIPLAKELRKNMPPWERKLWYEFLRNYPLRFQRQKAIGNYIVDFYCANIGLVIELDGDGHYTAEQVEKDKHRTKELEAMKLTVLRIPNIDVDRNFLNVCEYIDLTIKNLSLSQREPRVPVHKNRRFCVGFLFSLFHSQLAAVGFEPLFPVFVFRHALAHQTPEPG